MKWQNISVSVFLLLNPDIFFFLFLFKFWNAFPVCRCDSPVTRTGFDEPKQSCYKEVLQYVYIYIYMSIPHVLL